jgi:hypothetical protein
MNLLEGSIAFALVLAGLATLCTVLIEILHRLAGLRAEGLTQMLDAYFDTVFKPGLRDDEVDTLRADLMATLTLSALREKIHPPTGSSLLGTLYRHRLLRANVVSTEEFLQRLPDAKVFQRLKARPGQEAAALIADLVDKYEQYGAAASDYFKRRAQLLSLLMGIALALFANIHAVRIFDTFVKSPELAQRMEVQAGAIQRAIAQQPAATGAEAGKLDEQVGEALATLKAYQELGLPIGWGYYPNCFADGANDPRCKATLAANGDTDAICQGGSVCKTLLRDPAAGLLWLFTVVFTGILIGLGGPFWFDLAMRLSQVKQTLTGKAGGQPETTPAPASPRDQAIAQVSGKLAPIVATADAKPGGER